MQITPGAQALFESMWEGRTGEFLVYLSTRESDRGIEQLIDFVTSDDLTDRDMIFQCGKIRVAMRFDDQPHFISTTIDYINDPEGIVFRTE